MDEVTKGVRQMTAEWRRAQAIYRQGAKDVGLTDNDITILSAIYRNPNHCTQKYLVESTYLPKQTIHFIIGKLHKQKLITTGPSPQDGRVKLIKPTKAGQSYLQKTIAPFFSAMTKALGSLSTENQQQLVSLTHQFLDGLTKYMKQ